MVDRWGGAAGYPRPVDITDGTFPDDEQANPDFVVGVIDTGILPHVYLDAHLTADFEDHKDELPTEGSPLGPIHGHGTFVAGLVHTDAPKATIAMRAALDSLTDFGSDESVARAIRSLCEVDHLKVVNLSFFGGTEEHDPPLDIERALRELIAAHPDVVIVTAAGNRWTNALTWPAAFNRDFEQVIAVGAVDETVAPWGTPVPPKASFSNWGTRLDACAPGVDVIGPIPRYRETTGRDGRAPQQFTKWGTWSGTSFAAATVSGLIANAMIDGRSGPDAREWVLRGPKVALPGIAEEHWPPYVRGRMSSWRDVEALPD